MILTEVKMSNRIDPLLLIFRDTTPDVSGYQDMTIVFGLLFDSRHRLSPVASIVID